MTQAVKQAQIVLASASPRRRELLAQMGVQARVAPLDLDETPVVGENPRDYVCRLAADKARAGWQAQGASGLPVLGADTSVVCDGEILGKPADAEAARAMLARLAGRSHQVMTAVALASVQGVAVRLAITDVSFRALSEAEIRAYVATGEPLDKAGSYGIQGRAGVFVSHLAGSYSAVVGLPLQETAELLAEAGIPVWQLWEQASDE